MDLYAQRSPLTTLAVVARDVVMNEDVQPRLLSPIYELFSRAYLLDIYYLGDFEGLPNLFPPFQLCHNLNILLWHFPTTPKTRLCLFHHS